MIQDTETIRAQKPLTINCDVASAIIHPFGAHATSFQTDDGHQILFMSSKSSHPDKPIRGGIPLVLGQFGPGNDEDPKSLPQHGFARMNYWKKTTFSMSEKLVFAEFKLDPSSDKKLIGNKDPERWNNLSFTSRTSVLTGNEFQTEVTVINSSDKSQTCDVCFHTYFAVTDIMNATIQGLSGRRYVDKTQKSSPLGELPCQNGDLKISGEELTLKFFEGPPNDVILTDNDDEYCRHLTIRTSWPFKETVVWNPGVEAIKNMDDLNPEDYKKFICIEPLASQIIVPAQGEVSFSQTLSYEVKRKERTIG